MPYAAEIINQYTCGYLRNSPLSCSQRGPSVRAAGPQRPCAPVCLRREHPQVWLVPAGRMFWLTRNRLSGSYFCLMAASFG